jgi:hypothetical protein
MTETQIIIAFGSALIGSIVGGLIAIYAAIKAVDRTEYYRLRTVLKTAFQNIILNLSKTQEHPDTLVENINVDTLVSDVLRIMPCRKRDGFNRDWEEYRHDKEITNMTPREYTEKSPDYARKLITERLHKLTSKL